MVRAREDVAHVGCCGVSRYLLQLKLARCDAEHHPTARIGPPHEHVALRGQQHRVVRAGRDGPDRQV